MLLIGMCKEEIGPNYKTFIHEHSTKCGQYFPNYSNLITCWVYIDRLQSKKMN